MKNLRIDKVHLAHWLIAIAVGLLLLGAFPKLSAGQSASRHETGSKTVVGVRNLPLKEGAEALLSGDWEEGVRLTHIGLKQALGNREEEAGLSNLCAGYLQLEKYDTALMYCEMLLARNPDHWRGYNNRALIYIKTEQWEKARMDLERGEELNGDAYTMKVARALYMDAVHPVAPEIEVDDRETKDRQANDPEQPDRPDNSD